MEDPALGVESWPWLPVDEVVDHLGSHAVAGLDEAEAARRLQVDGPNELVGGSSRPPWRMFVSQFMNTLIVVLTIAAVVTVVVGDTKDAIIIVTVIVLNAVISFLQEYRAEQAIAALQSMTAPSVRVTRSGESRMISIEQLVAGDLIDVEPGDVVPADARLVHAPSLRVNEAPLTGESVPVDKISKALDDRRVQVADQCNMLFRGTEVTYGRGTAIVTATGTRTELGRIARLLKTHPPSPTPLQRRLAVLGRYIALGVLAISAVVFAVGVVSGEPASRMLLVAVSLAVAAIPESLPAVVTLSLALGAHRMASRQAIVRKLAAVETLGSVTVIATDKTGTLTQGRMQVEGVWVAGRELFVSGSGYSPFGDFSVESSGERAVVVPGGNVALHSLLTAAVLANDADLVPPSPESPEWAVVGDPTDGALLALAGKAGVTRELLGDSTSRLAEISFDSVRKRVTTVYGSDDGVTVATKGAVETILPLTNRRIDERGENYSLSPEDVEATIAQAERYAAEGFRVLAVAGRRMPAFPDTLAEVERELVFFGLVAMVDPPRPEAAAAVAAAHRAGIRTVMITGDHPATAKAIAGRMGILDGQRTLSGEELAQIDDDELIRAVPEIAVYARVTPEQKLDIVHAWTARGDVIAMTGDGVNDAPALRRSDIGVAMGQTGTEVSKEAADIVLADDNFASIVGAVEEGRRVYDNIRRFIRYGLIGGMAEIWVMLLAPFAGLPLALLPGQILWINLLTHGLPGLALGVEPAEPDTMRRPPRRPEESILAGGLARDIAVMGLWTGLVSLGLGVWAEATGRPWQTMIFTSLALLQLGNAMALRSELRSARSIGLRSNTFLVWTVVATFLLQLVAVYWGPLQRTLELDPLSLGELVAVLCASTLGFWAIEVQKAYLRRRAAISGE